ncbi:uncharacterized protein E0L32_000291 [Thyridium curvatum]|uniref:C2H2-type domain-containing protein n=1 Tax=Thyridium curvatum TaxID=1093900 RepID=A0A507B821_9PEZI|nr:uncharacterized protein E0L32_000291 [Thyridium curvatum]TPX15957.1 hypothetical protein E0L32_000291 [Thyridium curvatum]
MYSNGAWLQEAFSDEEAFSNRTIDPALLVLHPREEYPPEEEAVPDTNPLGLYYPQFPTHISETAFRQAPVAPFVISQMQESAGGVNRSPCATESSMTFCVPAHQDVQPVHPSAADTDTPMTVEATQEVTRSPLQSAYVCDLYDCGLSFEWSWRLADHKNTPHAQGHSEVVHVSGLPFECKCGDSFTKRTSLHRHILSLRESDTTFECTEAGCTRYRKEKAFQRKDHLVQHLRTYHKWTPDQLAARFPSRPIRPSMLKVCHFSNCPCYRDDSFTDLPIETRVLNTPFKTQSEYSKHMKDAHEWTPFSCDVPGCDKSGKKGYFSETALVPGPENNGAGHSRKLWKSMYFKPPLKALTDSQLESKISATVVRPASVKAGMTQNTVGISIDTHPEFSIEPWGHSANPPRDDGHWDNPCWPKAITQGPRLLPARI